MTSQRFPLRPSTTLYWAVPLFGACAAFFISQLGTDRGILVEGAIHIGPAGARVVFAVGGVCCLAFVAIGILTILATRGGRRAVELDDETILLPGSPLRNQARTFRFADVTSATLRRVSGQEFLTLVGPPGRSWVARSHVGDEAFDTIVAHVAARVPPSKAKLPVATIRPSR